MKPRSEDWSLPTHLDRVKRQMADDIVKHDRRRLGGLQVVQCKSHMQSAEGCPDPNYFVFAHAVSGGAVWEASKPKQKSSPGALTLNSLHQNEVWKSEGETCFNLIYLPRATVASVFEEECERPFDIGAIRDLRFAQDRFLSPQVRRIEQLVSRPERTFEAELEAAELSLASAFVRALVLEDTKPNPTHPLTAMELARLTDWIEAKLDQAISLKDMAGQLGLDEFQFSRAFKAATGTSPHQYMIHRRLTRVRELLERSDDRLVDITYSTGFSNQAHMTTAFSKHFGMPPGAWRKMVRT